MLRGLRGLELLGAQVRAGGLARGRPVGARLDRGRLQPGCGMVGGGRLGGHRGGAEREHDEDRGARRSQTPTPKRGPFGTRT